MRARGLRGLASYVGWSSRLREPTERPRMVRTHRAPRARTEAFWLAVIANVGALAICGLAYGVWDAAPSALLILAVPAGTTLLSLSVIRSARGKMMSSPVT